MITVRGCDEDGTSTAQQWSVVGDTWIVGCAMPESMIYPELNAESPDAMHLDRTSELGIYERGCGLDATLCAFGHDEYMYNVLVGNNCPIPEEGLYMIRFHSFYPWHKEREYTWMENEKDREMMPWVLEFNKFDLYSKADEYPDIEKCRLYYEVFFLQSRF